MAVDDNAETFWASKFDDTSSPVEYVIDFGEVRALASVEVSWEFPAKAFTVSLSADGEHFSEAFATDANVLKYSKVLLGSAHAQKLRISMQEVLLILMCSYRVWKLAPAPHSLLLPYSWVRCSGCVAFVEFHGLRGQDGGIVCCAHRIHCARLLLLLLLRLPLVLFWLLFCCSLTLRMPSEFCDSIIN